MLYSSVLVAATALVGMVSAQSLNYSTSGTLLINVTQIPLDLRQSWCRAETNSCPQICGGLASPNQCDAGSLNYTCTCSNGNKPNISDYDQTIPSFICAQWRINCIANHPNDLSGITACQSVVCGSKNASTGESIISSSAAAVVSVSTAAPSSSGAAASSNQASTTASQTSSATTAAATSATHSGIATAISVGKDFGTPILAAGLLAVFGLAL